MAITWWRSLTGARWNKQDLLEVATNLNSIASGVGLSADGAVNASAHPNDANIKSLRQSINALEAKFNNNCNCFNCWNCECCQSCESCQTCQAQCVVTICSGMCDAGT